MKISDYRPKIRVGQIWEKRKGVNKNRIIVTGGSKSGYHTVRYDNRKIRHHIKEKDFWIYYKLIGSGK